MSKQISVEVDKIYRFYDRYVVEHGVSCGWGNFEDAINAYQEASNCSHQNWAQFESVLDVGSGQGHLLKFLREERGFQGTYTGIEVLDFFYNQSLELYGEMDGSHFIHDEFLGYDFGDRIFDWVFSLGSFSVKQPNQRETDLAFCRKMIGLAKYGVSIFLNDIQYMRPGRLEEVPDLAAHDIPEFESMLHQNFKLSEVAIKHYPTEKSQPTMIHVVL